MQSRRAMMRKTLSWALWWALGRVSLLGVGLVLLWVLGLVLAPPAVSVMGCNVGCWS